MKSFSEFSFINSKACSYVRYCLLAFLYHKKIEADQTLGLMIVLCQTVYMARGIGLTSWVRSDNTFSSWTQSTSTPGISGAAAATFKMHTSLCALHALVHTRSHNYNSYIEKAYLGK